MDGTGRLSRDGGDFLPILTVGSHSISWVNIALMETQYILESNINVLINQAVTDIIFEISAMTNFHISC